ncbi:hypothetical protein V1L54_25215 [Streptomyces sp. TRM 70361]|uniref:hypothetical protein n=1 Tax=Streptomyces sp. TRM 70361 TaxID=3116553 RepID=UPI002E7AF3FB|nr:hypothetical protein [Streptomyces sp. TRM 70361]MEE1942666.1 hypothetical protein [Streptomyces sp. TRM 70361]
MTFAPAVERPWRDGWPLPAQPGDANGWVTGYCWLYCRRADVRVLWVGSVHVPGAIGDLYACGACIAELDHMVRAQSHTRDAPADRPRPGRHRLPRRRLYRLPPPTRRAR